MIVRSTQAAPGRSQARDDAAKRSQGRSCTNAPAQQPAADQTHEVAVARSCEAVAEPVQDGPERVGQVGSGHAPSPEEMHGPIGGCLATPCASGGGATSFGPLLSEPDSSPPRERSEKGESPA